LVNLDKCDILIMVELRKRKAPAEAAPAPPTKKSTPKPSANKGKQAASTNGASSSKAVAVGSTVDLEGFGREIETNDGEKTTLKRLVDESKGGVVLFTYPKASTPGCEASRGTQSCDNRIY